MRHHAAAPGVRPFSANRDLTDKGDQACLFSGEKSARKGGLLYLAGGTSSDAQPVGGPL